MDQKQYADMVEVMQCARSLCDALYVSLTNKGLIQKGFRLNLSVGDRMFEGEIRESSFIELETDIREDEDRWEKTRMYQRKVDKLKGWVVDADPLAEEGTVPPMVGKKKSGEDVCQRAGENPSKPYPLDGLWLSSRDDPAYVDGGQ